MTEEQAKQKLIVALDVDSFEEARQLIEVLVSHVDIFKVGSQLFTACGPIAVRYLLALGKKVFLDLKYHDIPNTVANAVATAVALQAGDALEKTPNQGILMYTMHTLGGRAMLEAAVAASQKKSQEFKLPKPLALGITVLTSDERSGDLEAIVLERARLAKASGLDGVVASPQEAALIRKEFGKDFVIVTPGIRPATTEAGDQKRVATPAEAIRSGSDFLVVGRPIVKASDPKEAARSILQEISQA